MSQLSLLVILALTVVASAPARRWLNKGAVRARYAAIASIAGVLCIPPAIAGLLRFDLDQPQPLVWDLGHQVARQIKATDRLALLVPDDVYDSVGSMLRGVLLFTPPRRQGLDIRTETKADAVTLESAADAGYTVALVTCSHGEAVLLRHTAEGWHQVSAWPYPADISHWRFAALLARGPLCAVPPQ
jgi:hypothetical protein